MNSLPEIPVWLAGIGGFLLAVVTGVAGNLATPLVKHGWRESLRALGNRQRNAILVAIYNHEQGKIRPEIPVLRILFDLIFGAFLFVSSLVWLSNVSDDETVSELARFIRSILPFSAGYSLRFVYDAARGVLQYSDPTYEEHLSKRAQRAGVDFAERSAHYRRYFRWKYLGDTSGYAKVRVEASEDAQRPT